MVPCRDADRARREASRSGRARRSAPNARLGSIRIQSRSRSDYVVKRYDVDLLLYSTTTKRDLAEFSLDPYIGCAVSILTASCTPVGITVVQALDCRYT